MKKEFYEVFSADRYTVQPTDVLYAKIRELNKRLLQQHEDKKRTQTVTTITQAEVDKIIKNSLVFNAVYNQDITAKNLRGKAKIYRDYRDFIRNFRSLGVVEQECLVEALVQRKVRYEKQFYVNILKTELKQAGDYKLLAKAAETAIKTIRGNNKAFENLLPALEF